MNHARCEPASAHALGHSQPGRRALRGLGWPTGLVAWVVACWLAWVPALCQAQTGQTAQPAGRRVALLVGNSQYQFETPLPNPVRDVRLLAQTLRGLGFVTQVLENLPKREMDLAIKRFVRESAGADTALLYYAGHGQQPSKGGRSYLLPVNANAVDDDQLDADGVAAEDIAAQLERLPNPARLRLVVLDACRNTRAVSRSTVRGLAPPARTDSFTLIAYSTDANAVAQDGSGQNSPYAQALAKHLPSLASQPVRQVFEATAREVREDTKQKQRPRTYGDLESRIGLDGVELASTAEPVPPANTELTQWTNALSQNTEAAYTAYLRAYPQGQFAGAARNALAALKPQLGQVVKDCADCPELVALPAGRFQMGSPSTEAERDGDEGPQHEVGIAYRLAVGRKEVSRGEFARFVQASGYRSDAEKNAGGQPGCYTFEDGKAEYRAGRSWRNPGFAQTDEHPVTCVSWNDAQAYLGWLNAQAPGRGYRLLSEAEWEYAARAGSSTRYPWGDDAEHRAQCAYANGADTTAKAQVPGAGAWGVAACDDGQAYTAPGGRFKANGFGLYDMHGNVLEWVQDVWHDNYSGAPVDGTAWTSGGDGTRRVLRGGSWTKGPLDLRSATRGRTSPDDRYLIAGFRIARTF